MVRNQSLGRGSLMRVENAKSVRVIAAVLE